MSLYYDGGLACDLKPDCPQQVMDTLHYLTRVTDYTFSTPPDHTFFTIEGWRDFLQSNRGSTCAPGITGSDFRKRLLGLKNDEEIYRYTLSFRRTMHDDTEFNVLWWHFLVWLAPYGETVGYVGYYREKYTLHPTLIYFQNGKVYQVEIMQTPQGLTGDSW